jgi:predicted small secreted protein
MTRFTMRFANRTARWAVLIGLVAALPMLSACNTLKGAGKDIQKIGEGVETGVKTVEQEVTN